MKYLIITLLFFITALSCSGRRIDDPRWTELTYHYQTGSIPPPYYFDYNINIKDNGDGRLTYQPDYNFDTTIIWGYGFKLNSEQIKELDEAIKDSKILTEKIPEVSKEKIPVGGSLQNLNVKYFIVNESLNITTPYFPESKSRTDELNKLYDLIKSYIPKFTWEDIDKRKQVYIKKHTKQ